MEIPRCKERIRGCRNAAAPTDYSLAIRQALREDGLSVSEFKCNSLQACQSFLGSLLTKENKLDLRLHGG